MEISLNEMRIFARHGVMPDERTLGAWFRVDVTADVDCQAAIDNDDLGATLNYAEVAEVVRDEMEVPSKLIEHVCGRIAKRMMREFSIIRSLTVTVSKEHPPVCVECGSASVRLTLLRGVTTHHQ